MKRPNPQLKPEPPTSEEEVAGRPLAVVWVSPEGARIFHRSENGFLPEDRASDWVDRTEGLADSRLFFREIERKLRAHRKIVILGPDMMKFHFRTFLQEQAPGLYRRIIGFETVGALSPAIGTAYLEKYEAD